jgi:hypothetical protein
MAALASATAPAGAVAVPSGTSAFASAAYFTGGTGMQSRMILTGSLSGLLGGLIGPIVTNDLNPLVAALNGSANTALAPVVGVGSTYSAGTPSVQGGPAPAAFPNDLPSGLPSPCTGTSTTQPCYSAATVTAAATPLAGLSLTGTAGYTQQVPAIADPTTPAFGRAGETAAVTVLGGATSLANPVVTTGSIDAKANCPNDGSTAPSATAAAGNVSLLNGAVTLTVAQGQISSITVGGKTYTSVNAVPVVTVGSATVSQYNGAIKVTVPLPLSQVLAGLSIPAAVSSALTQYGVSGNALTLTVIAGSGTSATKSTASAWGLRVAADLSGSLSFDLLGVARATVLVPSGISGNALGNVLDARLAYTSCSVGNTAQGKTLVIPVTLV